MEDFFKKMVSLEELEDFLRVSKSTIYRLVKEGWIPKPVDGKWQLAECVEWYIAYQRDLIIQKHVEKRF